MLALVLLLILSLNIASNLLNEKQELELAHNYVAASQAQEISNYLKLHIQAVEVLGKQVGKVYFSQSKGGENELKKIIRETADCYKGYADIFLNCDTCQFSLNNVKLTPAYIAAKEQLLWEHISYEKFMNSDTPVVGPLIKKTDSEDVLVIVVPIRTEEGRYCGYLLASLRMEKIYQILRSGQISPSGYTFLLGNQYQVIYHPSAQVKLLEQAMSLSGYDFQKASQGTWNYYSSVYDREETARFMTIEDLGWLIVVATPRFEFLLPLYRGIVLALCTFFVGVFIVLFIRDLLVNNIALPLSQLNDASKELSSGNLSYRVNLTNKNIPREINELGERLNGMAENLEKTNFLLRKHGSNLEKRVKERTQELIMKNKEMAALYAVASSVSNTYKLTDVLNQVFNEIMKLFEVQLVTTFLRRTDGNEQVYTIWGVNYPQTEKLIYTECTGRYSRMAVEKGEIIVINELQQCEEDVPLALRWSDMCSLISVPIRYQNIILGAVTLTSHSPNRFTEQEITILQAVCNQLGIVITNLTLFNVINEEHHTLLAIINSMHEGLILLDTKGKILYVNPLFFRMFYLEEVELKGEVSINELIEKVNPEVKIAIPFEELKEGFANQKVFEYGQGSVTYKEQIRYYLIQGFPVKTGEIFIGYGCVVRDITREKEIDKLKDSILSTVSHELRSPLTSIYGSAESLLRKDVEWAEEEKEEFTEVIIEESIRLRELIDNIMDMSKIQAGVFKLDIHAEDIGKVIKRVKKRFKSRYSARRFIVDIPVELPCVLIDERRIEQVFHNLLENAVKYSSADKDILINAEYLQETNMLKIGVIDSGQGIDPQFYETIFERFYRVDNARLAQIKGSGVGLSITKGIVINHGGNIWVESEVGIGSKFYFTLPCEIIEEERK